MKQADAAADAEIVEQSQESSSAPPVITRAQLDGVHKIASNLIEELRDIPEGDLVGEIIANAIKLLRDKTNRGDIKLINKSYKELRYALKIFAPYRDTRKVSIFGSARTPELHDDYQSASDFGKEMARHGWMVITGAGGGIMAAGHGGAGADPSFGLAIRLPFEQKTNVHIANDPKLINFKYFFTRKLIFLRSSHAVVVFPGGFGTMDEAFEVLTLVQTGKAVPMPILFVHHKGSHFWDAWQRYVDEHLLKGGLISEHDLHLYKITDSVEEAVKEVRHFYSNYHSVRYARDDVVLRLERKPSPEKMAEINRKFSDIKVKGEFRLSAALPVERDEPTLAHLPRLVFEFNRRDHGRMRMLIDYLNDLPEALSAIDPLREPKPLWRRIGVSIVLVLVPLMLLALSLPPVKGKGAIHKKDRVLAATVVIAALSLLACYRPTPLFPRGNSTLPLILFGTSLLLLSNIAWNSSFREYVSTHKYKREAFRKPMRTFHAPIYGRFDSGFLWRNERTGKRDWTTLPGVILSAGIAAAWFAWARRRPLEKPWDARSLAVLMGLQLALIVAFALCEPWPSRFGLKISGYLEFKKDIPAFAGVADTLRNYVQRMHTLKWYGQHYPPGNLILITIEKNLRIPGLTKSIVCLFTVLSVLPLARLAREIGLSAAATSAVLLLFAATTGVLIFCTINTTSLLLLPATICLWMLMRGLKTGSLAAAAMLGLSFAFYLFFSLSASILGLLMALVALIGWHIGAFALRNIVRTGVISLATIVAVIVLLRLTTHFNLIACFLTAVRDHQAQQGNEGFDDLKRYLFRSTGNVLAYLMSIVPLCILAVAALKPLCAERTQLLARSLLLALLATVLIAGFAGLFYLETERIWLFFTPLFALLAGQELARRSDVEGRRLIHLVLLLVLIISGTQEFFFMHYR